MRCYSHSVLLQRSVAVRKKNRTLRNHAKPLIPMRLIYQVAYVYDSVIFTHIFEQES